MLIAKKHKTVITFITVILIAAATVGCTSTGAEDADAPWDRARDINAESITAAVPWADKIDLAELTDAETEKLVLILNRLSKENFTETQSL